MTNQQLIVAGFDPRWPDHFEQTSMPSRGMAPLEEDAQFARMIGAALDSLERLVQVDEPSWNRDFSDRSIAQLDEWLETKVAELHGWDSRPVPSDIVTALREKAVIEDEGPAGYEPLMFLVGVYVGETLCGRVEGAQWALYAPPPRPRGAIDVMALEKPNTPLVHITSDHQVNPVGNLENIYRQRERRSSLPQFVADHTAFYR